MMSVNYKEICLLNTLLGPRAAAISSGVCAAVAGIWSLGVSAWSGK